MNKDVEFLKELFLSKIKSVATTFKKDMVRGRSGFIVEFDNKYYRHDIGKAIDEA